MQSYFAFEKKIWDRCENGQLELCRFERFVDGPVVPRGGPGSPDEQHGEFNNVIHNGKRFIMWYAAMQPPPKDIWHMEDQQTICIAYSDDGIHWEKPDLKLTGKKWGGAPDNVLPSVSRDVYGCSVIHDGSQYVMAHSHPRGIDVEEGQTTFSIYTSKDGIHWRGTRRSCIEPQHFETGSSMYRFRGKYWVLGQGVSPFYYMPDGRACGRVMFAYGSRDLKTWKAARKPAFAYDIPRYFPSAGIQNHVGAGVTDRGRVAIGFMGQFWPGGFSETVRSTFGLVYSHDGANWTEPFHAEPLLMPDEKGWDSGMLLQGSGLYSRGDKSYYWYAGFDGGNLWSSHASIGVVRMRRDGFAYYRAKPSEHAVLQTVSLKPKAGGSAVYLNCNATASNPIEINCIDRSGKNIWTKRVQKSGVLVPVLNDVWREGALRFKLSGSARLYSYYVGKHIENLRDWLDQWR